MSLLDDFFVRAVVATLGMALVTGPLGCFLVWRRMAYFGDATAHAALLGVAISLVLALPVALGVAGLAILLALAVTFVQRSHLAGDTILGVFAHASLALGILALALIPGARVDLMAYLFGDVLAVSKGDLAVIWASALAITGVLALNWKGFLNATINEELCWAEGSDPVRAKLVLNLLLALVIAISIKIVGALLIVAMLIIPAAAARPLSATPAAMAFVAIAIGALSAVGGLGASLHADAPAGPAIVATAALIFAISSLVPIARRAARSRRPDGIG